MKYRLIIADDHQLLIDGLMAVLQTEEDWEVLAPVNNGKALLDRLAATAVDLVLLDLNMPLLDGVQALAQVKQRFPAVKILVMTNYNQPQLQAEVRKLGASGYLLKHVSAVSLKAAITTVLDGGTCFEALLPLPAAAESWFLDDFLKKYQLTRREVEIIKMIGRELTSKEIGEQLFISELTVSTHRKNIMRKLAVKNMTGLVNFAREQGLI